MQAACLRPPTLSLDLQFDRNAGSAYHIPLPRGYHCGCRRLSLRRSIIVRDSLCWYDKFMFPLVKFSHCGNNEAFPSCFLLLFILLSATRPSRTGQPCFRSSTLLRLLVSLVSLTFDKRPCSYRPTKAAGRSLPRRGRRTIDSSSARSLPAARQACQSEKSSRIRTP